MNGCDSILKSMHMCSLLLLACMRFLVPVFSNVCLCALRIHFYILFFRTLVRVSLRIFIRKDTRSVYACFKHRRCFGLCLHRSICLKVYNKKELYACAESVCRSHYMVRIFNAKSFHERFHFFINCKLS